MIENFGRPSKLTVSLLDQLNDRLQQQSMIVVDLERRIKVLEDQVAGLAVK